MLNKESRVLVLGCGGMLGDAVYKYFEPRVTLLATDLVVSEPWLTQLDVRDWKRMREVANEFGPDYIINLAALTDLEYCEANPSEAMSTNAIGQSNAERIARMYAVEHVTYVSTAGVFSGEQPRYTESDRPDPVNVYGKTKLLGEIACDEQTLIVRAGWMMGGGPKKDKKFINKVYQQILAGERVVRAVTDKIGTPTYTHALAARIYSLINEGAEGIRHAVCAGSATRYDVAEEFVRLLGHPVPVTPCSSDDLVDFYPVRRATSETLISVYGEVLPHWKECLAEYVRNDFQS